MPASILELLRQHFFLPKPTLTEKNAPDQTGKVHIVTGGYAGCGYELAKILYQSNATVYVAGRSADKAEKAISKIKDAHPSSQGRVEFLMLDLADLTTIKASAEDFLRRENTLHVLTNNAGVMIPPLGSKTAQDFELQMGTNSKSPPGTVRVTWAASFAVELTPTSDGIRMADDGTPDVGKDTGQDYAMSKAGNVFYAKEFAKDTAKDSIVSVAWNPGNLSTELQRHTNPIVAAILSALMLFPSIYGGYTELYAAVSPDITLENNGCYIYPWGRIRELRRIYNAVRTKDEGGTGASELFWFWSEKTTQGYM